jgi:hypothetical protein
MIVAPTYPMLRDATLRTFLELTQGYAPSLLRAFHKSEMIAQLTNGTTVMLRSADDPDRLRGPNLGWFYLDEAAMMDADVWPIMLGRLRESPGRAWATSTPRGFNWMHEVFTEGGAEYDVTRSSTRDNLFLPPGFIRSLEQAYDTGWTAQEIEGEFLDLGAIDHFLPDMALWDACKDDSLPPLDAHTPCVLALDGAESNDTFATVIVSTHARGLAVRYVRPYVPHAGAPLDFDAIEADIRQLCARYAIRELAYDPFLLGQLIRRLKTPPNAIAVPCTPFPQGAQRLESDKALYDLITSRRIAHDGDSSLRQHISNANRKIDDEGRKLRIVKRVYSKKIDLAVALAMACLRASAVLSHAGGFVHRYDSRYTGETNRRFRTDERR